MPLYFTDKKKRWPPPKAVQYILAVLALLIAGVILVVWLRFFMKAEPSPTQDQTSTTTTKTAQDELPDDGYCLLIIEDTGFERFALIKFAPTAGSITVQPISPALPINGTETLVQMYRRTKAAQIVSAIATHYQLPLEHFVSLSIDELEALISNWGGSLSMALPEEITYRDENGALVRLPTDKNAMTPKQIGAILHHVQWQNDQNDLSLTANVTTALINQLLTADLNELYNHVADHTSVRVHHFNKYAKALAHLASINDGSLAQSGTIVTP